jgi:hypothetical protein
MPPVALRFMAPLIRRTEPPLASIAQSALTAFSRAIGAAKYFAATFHAVTDDTAAAMIALRRHYVDRAFETIEGECFAVTFNLERFVVVISAMCTFSHGLSPVQDFIQTSKNFFGDGSHWLKRAKMVRQFYNRRFNEIGLNMFDDPFANFHR